MRTQHRLAAVEIEPEAGSPVSQTMRATLRERAKTYIGRHVRDADLSVEKIAAGLNCSKRYLHLVFNAGDETVSEYIWRQRLEGCRAELSNPAFRMTLTEMAYAWGFNSSAHFSRAFKERFGVAPSIDRLRGRSGDHAPAPEALPQPHVLDALRQPANGPRLLWTERPTRQQHRGQS